MSINLEKLVSKTKRYMKEKSYVEVMSIINTVIKTKDPKIICLYLKEVKELSNIFKTKLIIELINIGNAKYMYEVIRDNGYNLDEKLLILLKEELFKQKDIISKTNYMLLTKDLKPAEKIFDDIDTFKCFSISHIDFLDYDEIYIKETVDSYKALSNIKKKS